MRICEVEGCNNKHEAKGYCKRHYRSFYKYGDPLHVKNIRNNKVNKIKPKRPYEENHKMINGIEYKLCSDCDKWLPMTEEYFYRNKANSVDRFNPYCKECTNKRSKKFYQNNREKGIQQRKDYYLNNKENFSEQQRKYRKNNWYTIQEYYKRWSSENKDKIKRYRIKREMNKEHRISEKEWNSCLEYFNYSCAYCGISQEESKRTQGQVLHKEHVNHKGANDLSNNIPACKRCNSRKWTYEFEDWFNEYNEIYTKERYVKILNWICEDYVKYIDINEIN